MLLSSCCVTWSGSEVAQYVAKHLPEVLKNMATYKKGEIKQSMIDSFLEMDQLIISDEVGNDEHQVQCSLIYPSHSRDENIFDKSLSWNSQP